MQCSLIQYITAHPVFSSIHICELKYMNVILNIIIISLFPYQDVYFIYCTFDSLMLYGTITFIKIITTAMYSSRSHWIIICVSHLFTYVKRPTHLHPHPHMNIRTHARTHTHTQMDTLDQAQIYTHHIYTHLCHLAHFPKNRDILVVYMCRIIDS